MKVCCVLSLESPHRGDSNEYTPYTIFNIKENHPKLFQISRYRFLFQGTQERVRNSRGKRAISVRATEVLLYLNSVYRGIIYIVQAFNKLHYCRLFVISSFRYFVIPTFRYFVFSPGVISSFYLFAWHLFVLSPVVISPRKYEITPGEKTTRRNNASRKDEKTPREKTTKFNFSNGVFSHGIFSSFHAEISSFRVAGFVFSYGAFSSFHIFAWRVFRLFAWRLFAAKKTKWRNPATKVLPSLITRRCVSS